jgi:uncharacterized protein YgiM (DUF1202 family)
MGFYFRKSKSFGPIRLNFSKSGLGISTGVPGARLVFSPKGTYVHLGKNGLYYKKYISFNKKNQEVGEVPTTQLLDSEQKIIETVNFDNLSDIDSQDFINELEQKNRKINLFKPTLFLGIAVFIAITVYFFIPYKFEINKEQFAIVTKNVVNIREKSNTSSSKVTQVNKGDKLTVLNDSIENEWIKVKKDSFNGYIYVPFVELKTEITSKTPIYRYSDTHILAFGTYSVLFILYILGLIKMNQIDKKRKTVEIYYELDEEMNDIYEKFINSFKSFQNVKRVWQIRKSSFGHNKKYHAGASTLINRELINERSTHKLPMKYFKTNALIPHIGLKNIELYFLPERLLIKKNRKFAAIMYKNLTFNSSNSSFVEDNIVPSDANIIEYTWKYVNKKGDPDRRFSNNKRIPVCRYSEYYLNSGQGLNEIIQTSKTDGFKEFENVISSISNMQTSQIKTIDHNDYNSDNELAIFFEFINQRQHFKKSDLQLKLNYGYSKASKIVELLQKIGAIELTVNDTYNINNKKLIEIKDEIRQYFD